LKQKWFQLKQKWFQLGEVAVDGWLLSSK